ncbi:hypothetical protein BCR43DRAFT_500112 [Syncephalastrum racemosum]|uniref:Chromatin modification-related protein n=1 Tax=Syncephalastrum racemosum TaxID=13706 RepID=A0A1X2GZ72_SYNRA|nr:hypothetical protein BCR43DRAFT_500112 [Syncephalastrum racemosum]
MSVSVADIFEDYVESLQNLPAEIDQNMHELRSMDEEFQHIRDAYTKHRRSHAKVLRANTAAAAASGGSTPPPNNTNNNNLNGGSPTSLAQSRQQLDKEYKQAVQKQDQKIELAMRMYDLVSRHIERIDSQMAKSGINDGDWIGGQRAGANHKRNVSSWSDSWRADAAPTKRSFVNGPSSAASSSSVRKRTHHSTRPNPAANHHGALSELDIDPNEPRYCICNQVSFGDMVACDGENCEKEWFHYACVGLVEPPAGKWFCDDCSAEDNYRKRFKHLSEEI